MSIDREKRKSEKTKSSYWNFYMKTAPQMYSKAEEQAICQKLIDAGEEEGTELRNGLAAHTMRYALVLASVYKDGTTELADLVASANLGAMYASKRFDPKRGVRFITFAKPYMIREICNAIQDNADMRFPSDLITGARMHKTIKDAQDEVSEYKAIKIATILTPNVRLDDTVVTDDEQHSTIGDSLVSDAKTKNPEEKLVELQQFEEVWDVLQTLSDRERDIVISVFGFLDNEESMPEISTRLGVSRTYAYRVFNDAKKKIRKSIDQGAPPAD